MECLINQTVEEVLEKLKKFFPMLKIELIEGKKLLPLPTPPVIHHDFDTILNCVWSLAEQY